MNAIPTHLSPAQREIITLERMELERQDVHEKIHYMLQHRDESSNEFWEKLNGLAASADRLSRAIELFRRENYDRRLAEFSDGKKGQ